jgi:Flp pilus assembly protein TadD
MGRSRRRQRHGFPNGETGPVGQGPILTPTYVTVRSDASRAEPSPADPPVAAPVLPLEGLEPWAEIAGPALLVEESPTSEETGLTFTHPDQLELESWSPDPAGGDGGDGEPNGAPHLERAGEPGIPEPASDGGGAPEEMEPVDVAPPPPTDPAEALYAKARTAAEEGRTGDALTLYRSILTRWPQHLRTRNNLALLLDAAGDHAGALAELDRALEMDPEHTTLLTNRGALLGTLGRYAAAERDLRRVLRVEPANVEALYNLGVVMTKKGLWGEAVPHLQRVTELAPERAAAFYYLGEALNHVDDLLGALTAYQRATELQPHNARALYGLGIIFDRLARPDDAALMYRKAREVARH